jgi:hypothetical protein
MKKLLFIPSLFCLFLLNVASICSNDDNNNSTQLEQLNANLRTGTWRITTFNDNGNDNVSQFNNRVFTFNENGTVTATLLGSTLVETSTYSITEANENNPNDDMLYLNIGFESPSNLAILYGDWEIDSWSTSEVVLYDPTGVNGGLMNLVFTKI